jgi:hypothetical protein
VHDTTNNANDASDVNNLDGEPLLVNLLLLEPSSQLSERLWLDLARASTSHFDHVRVL